MTNLDRKFDLLIVGGGVLGFFHAYHATQHGLRVVLLERNERPQGASTRNFGQVVPSGLNRDWREFGRQSLEIYKDIQSQFDITVRQNGSTYIASDEEELALIEELHAINREENYPSERWTTQQCKKQFPQLKMDYCKGGLYFPDEVSVNPRAMIHRLHEFLSQQSLYQSRFGSPVVELVSAGRELVKARLASGQTFSASKAIVCNGSDFQLLFPQEFQESNLQAVKLQMMRLKPQAASIPGNVLTGLSIRRYESFSDCPSWDAIKAQEPSDAPWKEWGIHILFKQELDGGIILGDSHEYASARDVDRLSFDIRSDINDFMLQSARQIFDLPDWEVESTWFGLYCQTDDPSGVFCHAVDESIHIVTGIGGKGMTSSAGFAKHSLDKIYFANQAIGIEA